MTFFAKKSITTPDDFYLYGNFNTDSGNYNSNIEFIYNIK